MHVYILVFVLGLKCPTDLPVDFKSLGHAGDGRTCIGVHNATTDLDEDICDVWEDGDEFDDMRDTMIFDTTLKIEKAIDILQ